MRAARMGKVATPEQHSGQRADRRALAEINDLIDDGVHDAASVLAWQVQRTAPGDPAVWLLLARIDYIRERFAAAMYAARMATRLDPSSSEAWLALAMTAVTRSRWRTEGLDAALQASALAPGDARTWIVLSQLHLQGGAAYDAAVAAERAVRVDGEDRGGHLMLGEVALEAQEWAHAEAAFRRVLALDGSDRHGRAGLSEALRAQGVDPADELARYGARPPRRARRPTRHVPVLPSRGRPPTTAMSPVRVMAAVIVGSLLVGLLAGLVVPGLGVVRGVVAGAAVALMWFAVRPLRGRGSPRAEATAGAAVRSRPPERSATTAGVDEEVADTADAGAHPAVGEADATAGGLEARADGGPADSETSAGMTAAAVLGDASYATVAMPDDPDALAELSRERLAASDVELAHAAASRLEAVSPGTVEAHRALGAVALAERDYEQVRHHYRRVLDLEPLDQEAHERLALVGDDAGRTGPRFPLRGFRSRR